MNITRRKFNKTGLFSILLSFVPISLPKVKENKRYFDGYLSFVFGGCKEVSKSINDRTVFVLNSRGWESKIGEITWRMTSYDTAKVRKFYFNQPRLLWCYDEITKLSWWEYPDGTFESTSNFSLDFVVTYFKYFNPAKEVFPEG